MATPDQSLQPASELSPPPPGAPSIPLPASRPDARPAPSASTQRIFDLLLIGIVLVFAFFAASFAVRNSDFWMHLASGRLLAEGRYQFGVDPFAFTTEGVYWANHAWLFDLLLYLTFTLPGGLGGTVLIVLKALLIAVLAAVLLNVRRPGSRLGVPAFCTLLAVLAMSPRLLLHSTCLSYLFLVLTFLLLWRARSGPATLRQNLKRYAPLLLLFVLWVNVDNWFLLGPLLAALFWLGELLLPGRSTGGEVRRTPAWLWLAGLAVCLLNPHHIYAFTLPVELTPLPPELRQDMRFEALFASPWRMSLLYQPVTGVNLATAAYFALLVLGLASFVLTARNLIGWRLLVWLSFAGLSAWVARTIPFFAVVAGPITALNLQDYLSRSAPAAEGISRRSGRIVVFATGLGLIFLAWPGWLQGWHDTGRHVDWTVQPDASLRRVAERLQRWHQGQLHDGRGFLAHPSVAHYCAWFCPEEKGFVDHRLPLFAAVAGEYEEVSQALYPALGRDRAKLGNDWRSILRKHGITHLVLYDSSVPRLLTALKQLAVEKPNQTLLDIDGQALILGWRDGERLRPEGVPAFDADRLAYTPAAGPEEEQMAPAAPGRGPLREPRSAGFWSRFASPVAPPAWESDAAAIVLRYFEDRLYAEQQKRATRCFAWAATLTSAPALSSGSLDSALRLVTAAAQMPFAPGDLGQQPPALPLLAVRLARRAVAENPDDANAYLLLAQAYMDLHYLTPERTVLDLMRPLSQLRHIQIAAALENVLRCQPDNLVAHEQLANLYKRRGYLDAELDHRREALRLTRRAGPLLGEKPDAFADHVQRMEDHNRALELQVGELKNEFALRTQQMGSEPYRKALLARNKGLARLALDDILRQAPMVLLGGEGVRLQMELLLEMGRIEPVREQLQEPDWQANKQNLGYVELPVPIRTPAGPAAPFRLPAYDWLLLCQSAAFGDYDQADAAVWALLSALGEQQASRDLTRLRPNAARVLAMELGVSASRPSWIPRQLLHDHLVVLAGMNDMLSYTVVEQADIHVLSGMLSLERGRPGEAEQSIRKAITLSDLTSDSVRPSTGRPLAEAYLRILQAARR